MTNAARLALVAAFGLALVEPAAADRVIDEICVVADPSGTPLNIREEPNGLIYDTIRNGAWVYASAIRISNGKPWAYVYASDRQGRIGQPYGWVFYRHLNCRPQR
ncbi:MAG: hypothetical protein GX886_09800 [Comamonadaceae bacterium]|nr:hypothetical protein [Comamonadaceae bacterium]